MSEPAQTRTPADSNNEAPGAARRRTLLTVGVGVAAAVVGGLAAWQRFALEKPDASDFWQQSFATLDGASVRSTDWRGRPLLVNFWATWCPPCIEELPLLSRIYDEKKANGWQFIGLAIDQPDLVQRFLARTPVSFPVVMAGAKGVGLTRSLGNAAGGLPFSVIFDAKGEIRQRKLGQLKPADLRAWIV